MKLKDIVAHAINKEKFKDLNGYIEFCRNYLDYVEEHLQAVIVSQNENHYQFYQYDKTGNFQITRPINSNLMYDAKTFAQSGKEFMKLLKNVRDIHAGNLDARNILNNGTYTIQQSIGAALDGLEAGKSNTARKLNGDLFEHFVRLILKETGVDAVSGVIQIPVTVDGQEQFKMSYQHDLIVKKEEDIKVIGSIKTSSKDRIDKIFIDKFLYNRLTETIVPHIAVFLNDVQRKNTKRENEYGINSTFLPGHFKGYTVKLNPLDGVYYCDIRPNMTKELILKDHIKTFDHLLIEDIWKFL
jgi:hypothetical protein